MAQGTLVEMQIKDGQRLIDRLADEGIPVSAAAWVKESEGGYWYLYLVTPLVPKEGGRKAAYGRVGPVIRAMQKEGGWIDPDEVKVISPHDPIAKDIVAQQHGRRLGVPIRYQGSRLGELAVDEAYIYPSGVNPESTAGVGKR
jgi:hypothetical protein